MEQSWPRVGQTRGRGMGEIEGRMKYFLFTFRSMRATPQFQNNGPAILCYGQDQHAHGWRTSTDTFPFPTLGQDLEHGCAGHVTPTIVIHYFSLESTQGVLVVGRLDAATRIRSNIVHGIFSTSRAPRGLFQVTCIV